jgi:hypothetical protein
MPGDYTVVLTAYNDSNPGGVSATSILHVVTQPTHFVASSSQRPIPPYDSWSTAATNIQDAIDAASVVGARVLVSNGVYSDGGRVVSGSLTNRVAIQFPLLVQSMNGAQTTTIKGSLVDGSVAGESAVRCVYLCPGAILAGFTLTGGSTRASGDSTQQSGGAAFSVSTTATVSNCIVGGNAAYGPGGGVMGCTVDNSLVISNLSITANGGGLYAGIANNCTVIANSSYGSGSGVGSSTLRNCIVYFNDKSNYYAADLNYCCTTPLPSGGYGNIASDPKLADVAHLGTSSPCIGAGSSSFTFGIDIDGQPWASPPSIGCDEPAPGGATTALNVRIGADFTNVVADSPVHLTALIDGNVTASRWEFDNGSVVSNQAFYAYSWVVNGDYPVVLRAYNDTHPGGVAATLIIHVVTQSIYYVDAKSPSAVPPYSSWTTAATNIQDAVDAVTTSGALVLVNDGVYGGAGRVYRGFLTNRVLLTSPLVVRSLNGPLRSAIVGFQAPGTTNGDNAVRCAYLSDGAVLDGFTIRNGATRSSGDLVHEQSGGGLWGITTGAIVTNCILSCNSSPYSGGGAFQSTLVGCVLTSNSCAFLGGGSYGSALVNCVMASNFAVDGGAAYFGAMTNCLATNNLASQGGGMQEGVMDHCSIIGNTALSTGGGISDVTAYNCVVANNKSSYQIGAANNCTLYSCTIASNSAPNNAGVESSTLVNCILYYNLVGIFESNFDSDSKFTNCCTTPFPSTGLGNFTSPPIFVDVVGGNWRLQSNSPCIDAGANALAVGGSDLDGRPRIVGGTVDVGAYEFQNGISGAFIGWLQQFGLATDGSADFADSDGDGLNNWQEWVAGTVPTNAASALLMVNVSNSPPGLAITWQSASGKAYFLQRATDLASQLAFSIIQSNILGSSGTTTYYDSSATNPAPYFYRVGVSP